MASGAHVIKKPPYVLQKQVTLLLYEAVLAEHALPALELASRKISVPRNQARVLVGNELENHSTNKTEEAYTLPPALPIHRDFVTSVTPVRFPETRRRKNLQRKKQPRPFKPPKQVPVDSYMFGDEYDKHVQSSQNYEEYSPINPDTSPKSIQDIIHYFSESKPGSVKSGVKFSGSFRQPHGGRGLTDLHHDGHDLAASDPLEDFRIAGDPMEVNSGLLGYGPLRNFPPSKPIPVSLMLDIFPMKDRANKKPKRPRPSLMSMQSSNFIPEVIYSRPPSDMDHYPASGPYRNRMPPSEIVEIPHYTRDREARPSYMQEVKRPYSSSGLKGDNDGGKRQIRLQLNFFPKKKNKGPLGIYERMQTTSESRYSTIKKPKWSKNNGGWTPSTSWPARENTTRPQIKHYSNFANIANRAKVNNSTVATSNMYGVRLPVPTNHKPHQSRLEGSPPNSNLSTMYGQVGSHGYAYELPSRFFFSDPPPEPRDRSSKDQK